MRLSELWIVSLNGTDGMSREGLYRKKFWSWLYKEWIDEAVYAILTEDYFSKKQHSGFWAKIDMLIFDEKIVIDRPEGSKHLRFDFVYPLDYGYMKDTNSPDGGGIDVWLSSKGEKYCDAIICTVDILKKILKSNC